MSAIRRALLSVADKRGVVVLARELQRHGVRLLSTGGTARLLAREGIGTEEVSSYTGVPEMLSGRVKTLHPRIHGGLLARRGIDDAELAAQGIEPIDLLAVNLYPFAQTIARPDCSYDEAIEHIDVGGPALLRAAAKNHADVTVLTDPDDYPGVIEELDALGGTSIDTRARLAAKAFTLSARYDTLIAAYLLRRQQPEPQSFPEPLTLYFEGRRELRYGENPQQRAALYRDPAAAGASVASAELLQGMDLSYNNLSDADTAIECVRQFAQPACVIVKHANPCGAALATSALLAYQAAHHADPTSAYGGIIAFNRELDGETARSILERQFAELIAAPRFTPQARAALASKPTLRLLATGEFAAASEPGLELRSVTGGLLLQESDQTSLDEQALRIVTRRHPEPHELADLLFAWRVARFVKSNAIVFARDRVTVGVGAGQMSRVDAARVAALKASDQRLEVRGAVMASDAFLPFRDGIDVAAGYGVRAVIQPGGSKRDPELIAAADQHGMAMAFTGQRHFRH